MQMGIHTHVLVFLRHKGYISVVVLLLWWLPIESDVTRYLASMISMRQNLE